VTTEKPEPPDTRFDPTQSMELVWQGQRGDAGAVNELFTRYSPRLRRIVNVRIPIGEQYQVDPDDIVQETLIVANRRLSELQVRTPYSIINWLAKIADYKISDRREFLRAERRNPAKEQRICQSDESEDSSGIRLSSTDPTPSQEFVRNEEEELMDQQMQLLEPADYREVILLRDYFDADWETIRCKLGRPTIDSVKELHQRAHKRLKQRMSKFRD